MLKEIYNMMYTGTERGRRAWIELNASIDAILQEYSGDSADQRKLEDALTAAAEAGLEQGFLTGARFIMELFTDAII